jgi:hypothetical protein
LLRCARDLSKRLSTAGSCAAATVALAAAAMAPVVESAAERRAAISITTVDAEVTGFGTFQSHNQKVVSTPYGIFLTYAKTPFARADWRLVRSTDGGRTFTTIWHAVHQTHPPALEAAADGTLYMAHGDAGSLASYVYRLSPRTSFALEPIATIVGGYAQKFSLLLDEARGRLHYAAYLGPHIRFTTLDLEGTVTADVMLTGGETVSSPSYPHIVSSDGMLYVAWSTDRTVGSNTYYRSIHVVRSPDGGLSWESLAGRALTPPFAGDEAGAATEVTLLSERACVTWLTGFTVQRGKAHFFYLASPNPIERGCPLAGNEPRYQRMDASTGVREASGAFAPAGLVLDNPGSHFINGFFAVAPESDELFLATQTADNRLVVVALDATGTSWRLLSQSPPLKDHLYAIGGQRSVTCDGLLLGTYTDDSLSPADVPSAVRFFSVHVH